MFKKGDKIRKVSGEIFSNGAHVVTVGSVDSVLVWILETATNINVNSVYLVKPHKHAELIKAWADGAEIEYKTPSGKWFTLCQPTWLPLREYRVKPALSPQEIEKQSIIEEIGKLQKRLDNLDVG